MFSDSYYPYISGVVRSIERLSNGLRAQGHRVTIFGPSYPGHRQEEAAEVDVQRCPSLPISLSNNMVIPLPKIGFTLRTATELDLDIIHSHSPFTMGQVALTAARELDIPVVFTHHSLYHTYSIYAPKLLQRSTEKMILEKVERYVQSVDAVISPSPGTSEFIRRAYGIRSTVISNPIMMGRPDPTVEKESTPTLIFVGRQAKEKNLDLLIRAFALVRRQVEARLVLVGDGSERHTLENLVEDLGIADSVKITGFLSFDEVVKWYRRASIFLFPSYNETQGMVMLEAMAHGLPVIAVRSEASKNILDECDGGIACDATPHDMAEKTLQLLHSPHRLEAMSHAAAQYAAGFSTESIALQVEGFYRSVISSHSRPLVT